MCDLTDGNDAHYDIVNVDAEWDSELRKLRTWTLFQTSRWVNLYRSVFFPSAELAGFRVRRGAETVGLLPIITVQRIGMKVVGSPLRHAMTPHMGFAAVNNVEHCVSAFWKWCALNAIRFATLTLPFELQGGDTETCNGWRCRRYTTSVIDLDSDLDHILKNMHGSTRNQVRQGEKNNLDIVIDADERRAQHYLELRRKLYAKQGIDANASNSFVQRFCESFFTQNCRMISALHEGHMIAAVLLLTYGDTCLYWDGVSDAEVNRLRPNNVLQWRGIQWAKTQGFRFYDMGGTNTPSIAQFKRGFGGREVAYSCVERFSPALLAPLFDIVQKIRRRSNPRLHNTGSCDSRES